MIDPKVLLVDIDGTLTQPISSANFGRHPKDYKAIPEAKNAIAYFKSQGCAIAGISNQGGVASGHKSLNDCHEEQKFKLGLFPELSFILYCTDFEGRECWFQDFYGNAIAMHDRDYYLNYSRSFRKPNAGMVHVALDQLIFSDKPRVLFVGDRSEDVECAINAQVKFMEAVDWRDKYGSTVNVYSG